MTLIKRIMISITRRKAKSLLLMTFVFVLGTFVGASYLVNQVSDAMIREVNNKFDFYAFVRNTEAYDQYDFNFQTFNRFQNNKYTLYQQLSESNLVSSSEVHLIFNDYGQFVADIDYDKLSFIYDVDQGSLIFSGISSNSIYQQDDVFQIVEGRYFKEEEMNKNVLIIPETMSYRDGTPIQIGDHLKINYQNYIEEQNEGFASSYKVVYQKEYDFEVVGRYHFNEDSVVQYSDVFFTDDMTLIPFNTFNNMRKEIIESSEMNQNIGGEFTYSDIIYKFDDYDNLIQFKEIFEKLNNGNPFLKVLIHDDGYGQVKRTSDNIVFISKLSMVCAIIASVIIGMLMIYLYLKDRKREVGIMIAMGEHKKNILIQLIGEIVIIGLLGLLLSIGSGNYMGNKISNHLLENKINTEEKIDVEVSPTYCITMILGGSLIFILAAAYPTYRIVKLKPKSMIQ